jgi:kynureninase
LAVITPAAPAAHGCQLSVRLRAGAAGAAGAAGGRRVFEALNRSGVVCDWREPDIIRLAPVPLYNGFEEVWQAAQRVAAILKERCNATR